MVLPKGMKHVCLCILLVLLDQDDVFACQRRRNPAPSCTPVNCKVGRWSGWSSCSHRCGSAGTQTQTRYIDRRAKCGGSCPYELRRTRGCNRNACKNRGTPAWGKCICPSGWTGTCCERDVNECLRRPRVCAHNCHNTLGSFTCSCRACYTKHGPKYCYLRQCKIGGRCYEYGTINPANQCQDCQNARKTVWTNNNALSCSDNKLCTRNDRCVNGVCIGTPFTCRSCESCDGSGCRIKPGFCVIDGICFTHGTLRHGKPCQQCNSNNPTRWTANNNLKCSDNNVKTRDDRCVNGECRGDPFNCLACQKHYHDTCRSIIGYCVIRFKNTDSCYSKNTVKPGNPCQWCNPEESTTTWTNKNGVACSDGQPCTRSDRCQYGQCKGISFSCNDLCQYCNGNDCSLRRGYGYVGGKCTCKIAGRDYSHQQLNPENQCQWCDLHDKSSKNRSAWSNRPVVPCNDGNACTKLDTCQRGRCVGSAYSCQVSFPQASCIHTSQCVGDGTCRNIMKNNGTICRPASDQCDQSERCNGVLGTCPPRVVDAIRLQQGKARLMLPSFMSSTSFQYSTSNLYLRVSGFSVTCGPLTVKWSLLNSADSCAFGRNSISLSPNKNSHPLTGLTLINNQAYKIAVQALDLRGPSGLPVCTSPVTIDTSKPKGGWVRDGLATEDLAYQTTKTISSSWGGFQTRYGVARYDVAVLFIPKSTGKETTLQDFTNVNLTMSFTKTFMKITDGSTVVTKVRAFTKAGLYSEIASDGVVVDTSPPLTGSVVDGLKTSSDLRYANWTNTYQASWTKFNDPHAPIIDYEFGIKQKNGVFVSSGWTAVGVKYSTQISGVNLVSGLEYCALIKGINAAALSSQASSNCVLIDHDAPRPGSVNDGSSADVDYQSEDDVFHANWDGFSDGPKGSGISEYKYRIQDERGKKVTSWVSAGSQTNVTARGITLLDGNTYYITIRAVDRVGLFTDVKSDGVRIDISHPVYSGKINIEGKMATKNNKTVVYITSNSTMSASWPQFVDKHSGMRKYQWSIKEMNLQPTQSSYKDIPGEKLATRATFKFSSIVDNIGYQLYIRGVNNAGLHTDITSYMFIPLTSAPDLGTVSDGSDPTIDSDFQTNASEVHATWKGFGSSNVEVNAYYIAVGSCMTGNYHVTNSDFVLVKPPRSTSFHMYDLHLVNGQRYCVKVKAENLAGVQTDPVSSDGFLVDVSPPDVRQAMILDGRGDDDIDYQTSNTELSVTWFGFQDYESGINHFEVAVSRRRAGQPDVTSSINIGHNMTATVSGLNLANDVYYVMVCAVNNAKLRSCLTSDGVLIDPTIPTRGVVHDGILEPDVRYQSSTTKVSANWERIWDLESRVERFEWGIGTTDENDTNVQNYKDVGLQTHIQSSSALALKHGYNYTVFLRVYNRAGGIRELNSDGVTIDTTAPFPSVILPGVTNSDWKFVQASGAYYTSSASEMYVSWENFREQESEIWYYKWSIGTSRCGTQVQALINIGLSTTANTSGSDIDLRPGVPYYVTVMARNRARLVSRACSPAFIFDYTPPVSGNIRLFSRKGVQKLYFSSDEKLNVNWQGFEDPESGIASYEVSINDGNVSFFTYKIESEKLGLTISLSELLPGKSYQAIIKCINNAGLSKSVPSEQFTVDNTPPVYTGNTNDLPRRHFKFSTRYIEVTWQPFKDIESPIVSYEVGVGTQALRDDIHSFTGNGLSTDFKSSRIKLEDTNSYFVTIKAINAAGLARSIVLEQIIIDKTPPTGRHNSIKDGLSGDLDFMSLNESVSAHWENIEDLESGISKVEYCVGSTPSNCRIKPFTFIHQNKSFVCSDCNLQHSLTLFTRFRVTNGAGLSSTFASDGITIDSSPPEIGAVFDGERTKRPDVEKVEYSWMPMVTWYGARDLESAVRYCEWQIIEHDGETEVSIYRERLDNSNTTYNVRRLLKVDTALQLNLNRLYINVIQCSNQAGLSTKQYSNGWSVVGEWPVTSNVIDGTEASDIDYDINGDTIGARWEAFRGDSRDPVVGYQWAVGTYTGLDDVIEFTEVGLMTRASLALSDTDIELEPGLRYYVTVRATTLSGKTSTKSSDGFIVDTSPPKGSAVRVTHNILDQERKEFDFVVSWEAFSDSETGIYKYEYCLGYIKDVCFTSIMNAGTALNASVSSNFLLGDKDTPFYAIVIATNHAGLKTIVSADEYRIDVTPPKAGSVFDGLEEDLEYINSSDFLTTTWSEFNDPETGIKKCTLTVSEDSIVAQVSNATKLRINVNKSGSVTHSKLSLTPSFRYVSTIECENPDGFKSSSSSDGVIVDDSPPKPGFIFDGKIETLDVTYQSSTEAVHAHWLTARDPESGLKEYLVAVGSGSSDDNVQGFYSVGLETEAVIANLTLQSGSTYYVTLEIVNKAGLRSRVTIKSVTVDATKPVMTEVKLQASSASSAFIGPKNDIAASWSAYDDESGIDFSEYCVGTTAGACQLQEMRRVPGNQTTIICFNCQLEDGYTYFISIRVWNNAGLFSLATTEAITADLTPPDSGKVTTDELYMPCLNRCALNATFSGFKDDESGVKNCEFTVESANGSTVVQVRPTTSNNHVVAENLRLRHDEQYRVAVTCINILGEKSIDVYSSPVKIDNTPPEKGKVFISPDANHDVRRKHRGCHFLNSTLRVFWTGFSDKESDIAGFRVAIGRKPSEADVVQFRNPGIASEVQFQLDERYGLSRGDRIFATVEATNKAGLKTEVASLPTRLISASDSSLVKELHFQCVNA